MMHLKLLLLLAPFAAAPQDAEMPDLTAGLWSGGYGVPDGDEPRWSSMYARFERDGEELVADLNPGRAEPLRVEVALDGDELSFAHPGEERDVKYSLRYADGALRGTRREGRETEPVLLVHEPLFDDAKLASCAGVYGVDDEHRISVVKSKHLILTDFGRGHHRVLYVTGEDELSAGPAFALPEPSELTVAFERDEAGEVVGLTLREAAGATFRAKRRPDLRTEPFAFQTADDLTIRGTLTLPAGDGPHPAVVWVHGSGRASRAGGGVWAQFFPDRGFAFLAVDKRGVGESDGKYEMPDGGHDNVPHMMRRARDVRSAVAALKARDDVDGEEVGLSGISQAGWVIPLAAEHGEVAFCITLSGGATRIGYESRFSKLAAENESSAKNRTIDEAYAAMEDFRPRDYDFRKHFAAVSCPALWLYGDRDRSNPSRLCVELIEAIAREGGNDFTVKLFPTANHGLKVARLGGARESAMLGRYEPELFVTAVRWLKEKSFGPR